MNNLVDKFNCVIGNIFEYMIEFHSDKMNMKLYYDTFDKIIQKDKSIPIIQFLRHVYANDKYKDNILNRNDEFFLNYEVKGYGLQKIIINKIFSFKKIWKDMEQDEKDYIKNCLVCLVKISHKYLLV